MAITFPNPAAQTPVNTFSPTSTPASTTNGLTYIWNGSSWTSSGGGGGTAVTGVTVTAPITDTGTSTAPVIGISAATTAAAGSVQLATAATAAAGTNATQVLTPAVAVPKSGANMTGAALIPGGNDAARPATPTVGMLRYNNQAGLPAILEFYTGFSWSPVPTGGEFMGNVIYGSGSVSTGSATVTHTAVDLSKSYIVITATGNGGNSGVYISSRATTSFTVSTGDLSTAYSYFLIY